MLSNGLGPNLNKLVDKLSVQYRALSKGIDDAILGIFITAPQGAVCPNSHLALIDRPPHRGGLINAKLGLSFNKKIGLVWPL